MINAGGDYFSSWDFLPEVCSRVLTGQPSCGVKHFALLAPGSSIFARSPAFISFVTRTAEVKDGCFDLEYTLGASNVLFLEIK